MLRVVIKKENGSIKRIELLGHANYDEFGNWQHEIIELKPLNKDYNPIVINAEEAEDFRVIGEFIGVVD